MQTAYQQAQKAFEANEIPIGGVLVCNNKIIAKAHNQTELLKDPTAHAEILCITQACATLQSKYLNDTVLYVTVEPCLMCYGAIVHAKIRTLVYGTSEPKTGFSIWVKEPQIDVVKGVFEEEGKRLMMTFFENKRQKRF